jgi:hypothetical protein
MHIGKGLNLLVADLPVPGGESGALLGRARDLLIDEAQARGVELQVSHDWSELVALNEANLDSWFPLPVGRDPRLSPGNSFWLRGIDRGGEVVLTRAARLFDWTGTTMHDELVSMRLFYPDPEVDSTPGEFVVDDAFVTRAIGGHASYQWGAWHRPDHRGRGLSAVSARAVKLLTLLMWRPQPSVWTSLVNERIAGGMADAYGVTRREAGIHRAKWHGSDQTDYVLFWMSRADFLADLARMVQTRSVWTRTARLPSVA